MERNPITGFKVDFNITDYADILPDIPERIQDILNWDIPEKDCVWKRVEPKQITPEYIEQEITRILRTGVWIFIHKQPVWLPPNYYFFLQYFKVGGDYPEFRLSRLKAVYFQIKVRNNPYAIGTFTIKSRQIGETSFEMSNCLHEVADGNMSYGSIGMQSKTNDTVKNSCWRILKGGWRSLPKWLRDILYSDFASGDNIETKMAFVRPASEDVIERDILITYGASTDNSFDSMNNMRLCVLDEVCKAKEYSFYSAFLNYEKFIAPGKSRRGLFKILSSPADFECKSAVEAMEFWKGSDPKELTVNNTTSTRVFRYYSSPLEGLQDMYDKYGDADADEILEWIKEKRKSVPKDKQLGEVRAYPLNEDEMFGSYEAANVFSNIQGIKDRITYLSGIRFKDAYSKEPVVVYGNLEREEGYTDGNVNFRMSDKNHFDILDARFCFSYLPQNRQAIRDVFTPPSLVENVVGVDPFNFVYHAKNVKTQSSGAMVNRKFLDLHQTGIVNCPTMIYCCRPQHIDTFYQDIIKAAIYNRSMIQIENKTDGFAKYAEENGYIKWLLPSIGETASSKRFGDSPSGGKNGFLNEGIAFINANTNTPLHEEDPYYLEFNWFADLLRDYTQFNPLDTHKNDLTMADMQSHIGAMKLTKRKVRQYEEFNVAALSYHNY